MTELAHRLLRPQLHSGDVVVDATCGNGHDTLFLADAVGPVGRVYALDLQDSAIEATRERLQRAGCDSWVTLQQISHDQMAEVLAPEHRGQIKAIMFNLGYLPGADKSITTTVETTLPALEAARDLLAADGLLCLLVYPGHPEGAREAQALESWLDEQEQAKILECRNRPPSPSSPYLILSTK